MTAEKGSTNGAAAATEPLVIYVDRNRLTIGEITAAEALSGVSIDESFTPGRPKGAISQALACVVQQRTNPGFTFADAADAIVYFSDSEPIPPTNGRVSSTRSRSRSTSRSSPGKTSTA
jgi:hypothetical protein